MYPYFLHADADYKARRAVKYYGIAPDKAAAHVARTNAVRRNHYAYYTGKMWGDRDNYDAIFDTSKLSADAIVSAVVSLAKNEYNS